MVLGLVANPEASRKALIHFGAIASEAAVRSRKWVAEFEFDRRQKGSRAKIVVR